MNHRKRASMTLALIAALSVPAAAQQPKVDVDKTPVQFNGAKPAHEGKKVVAPVRDVAEKMGATVDYNAKNHKVTIETPQKDSVVVNGTSAAPTDTATPTAGTTSATDTAPMTTPAPADTATAPPVQTSPAQTAPAPVVAAPVQTTPAPPASTTAEAPEQHNWVPYVIGAIVLLGLLAYFLNRRGKTGQVIAADDKDRR